MKTTMDVHPAAKLFPMLEDDGPELQELANDIKKNGLRNPILTLGGMILDGRNRLRACEKAGVKPTFREWKEGGDPFAHVWSLNGERRHLEPNQRAAIRLMVLKNSEEWAKKNAEASRAAEEKRRHSISESVKSQPRAEDGTMLPKPEDAAPKPATQKSSEGWERNRLAKETGTSPATISRLQKVDRQDPEALQRIATGKQKLSDALRSMKPDRLDFTEVSATEGDRQRINMLRELVDELRERMKRFKEFVRHAHMQFNSGSDSGVSTAAREIGAWLVAHEQALAELEGMASRIRPMTVCRSCSGSRVSGDASCSSCEGEGFLTERPVEKSSDQPPMLS